MSAEACCTCASLLAAVPHVSASSEKPLPDNRHLACCGRIICGACISANPRFLSYCPYCQSSGRSPRSSSLKERQKPRKEENTETEEETDSNPPPYSTVAAAVDTTRSRSSSPPPPPPYTPSPSTLSQPPTQSKATPKTSTPSPSPTPTPGQKYTIHHIRHPPHPHPDTLPSLSLRYGIPLSVLRSHNNIPRDADYLLAARHTLLIPTEHITITPSSSTTPGTTTPGTTDPLSMSLSPTPLDDAPERARKTSLRRFMVSCKEADYDTARVYLEESGYDLDEAVARYLDDVAWERAHPFPDSRSKGKGRESAPGGRERGGRGAGLRGRLTGLVAGGGRVE